MRSKNLLRLRGKTIKRIDKIREGLIITFTDSVRLTCCNEDKYEGDFRTYITEKCDWCLRFQPNCKLVQITKWKNELSKGIRLMCKECRDCTRHRWKLYRK